MGLSSLARGSTGPVVAWLEQAYATWDSQHALGEDLDTVEHEAEVPCAELVASDFDGEVPPIADLLARRPSSVATAAAAAIRDALAATGMASAASGRTLRFRRRPQSITTSLALTSGPPRHPTPGGLTSPLYPSVYPSGYFSRYVSIWSFRSAFAS